MFYVATFREAVYVLHVFEKKTRKTSARDLALGQQRYGLMIEERRTP
jgi:phage-related protein